MTDLTYSYRHVNRHQMLRDRLFASAYWTRRVAELHDRLIDTDRQMDPYRNHAKCRVCGEPMNNPKRHDCPDLNYLRQAL